MAEETPLNVVGPGAGPNRTQNRNPFEVGRNADQEPNTNRLREREARADNRAGAAEDRVEITREGRDRVVRDLPETERPAAARNDAPQRQRTERFDAGAERNRAEEANADAPQNREPQASERTVQAETEANPAVVQEPEAPADLERGVQETRTADQPQRGAAANRDLAQARRGVDLVQSRADATLQKQLQPRSNVQETALANQERQAQQSAAAEPAAESLAPSENENSPTPVSQENAAERSEEAAARQAENEPRREGAERRAVRDAENERTRNPVNIQTQVGRNVDRLV